ncbi:Transcriptional elongation regulator MINIYO [Nymphaea thermarum]|nr:Transcriptional elongation regulator MINIYO [Nymphaea thermarum]
MVKEKSVPAATPKLPVEASKLVGRIVEKGFSSTSGGRFSLPEPSLLPFPVARHRSHGPHWAPRASNEDEEDVEQEETDPVADFAQPIRRRPKKGLDLSKWKELVPKECLAVAKTKRSNASDLVEPKASEVCSSVGLSICKKEMGKVDSYDTLPAENEELRTSGVAAASLFDNLSQGNDFSLLQRKRPGRFQAEMQTDPSRELGPVDAGAMSNMNDIDADNNVILQAMSYEEIAEAQAEIKERFKPEMVEMLKKRGKKKLETQNKIQFEKSHKVDLDQRQLSMKSEKFPQGKPEKEHELMDAGLSPKAPKLFARGEDENINKASKKVPGHSENTTEIHLSNNSTWQTWSNRVEAAKKLRFTLDGSVVTEDLGQYKFDNVNERDFLRTEGDPGAAGYTIKEAVSLVRSMIPGQRALALQLLVVVLEQALCNLQPQNVTGCELGVAQHGDDSVDWQALWAYAIGPEPELILTLRMALDDNHASVLVACTKVIHCILCCNLNEYYFLLSELVGLHLKSIYTAPVFRVKGEISSGFLNGGFWKYSAKPSNIIPFKDQSMDENDEEHTIKDDVVVAEQDIAAGLMRMGVLPRIRYIMEMDHNVAAEEYLLPVLIAFARHSPACALAIMECPRLVDTVINRFVKTGTLSISSSETKSIRLLTVLSESSKSNCEYFIKNGAFTAAMRHIYASPNSLEQWLKFGRESAVLISSILVELLCFWKVCICYGYCISYFSDFFPAMCLWLSPPAIDKLIGSKVFCEFNSVAKESYMVLEILCRRLPYPGSDQEGQGGNCNSGSSLTWSWGHAFPMVDFALKWMSLTDNPSSFIIEQHLERNDHVMQDSFRSSLISVIASVLHMLCSLFERMTSEGNIDHVHDYHVLLSRLSKCAANIVQQIDKNGLLSFSDTDADGAISSTRGYPFVEKICYWRTHGDYETSISCSCLLDRLIRLVFLLRKFFHMVKQETGIADNHTMVAINIVSQIGLEDILVIFMNFLTLEWHIVQSIEMCYRGGPAPGLGIGWGSYGGGFWSTKVLLSQIDARVVVDLLELHPIRFEKEEASKSCALQKVSAALAVCLILGPQDTFVIEKAFKILFDVPVLKFLSSCIHCFLYNNLIEPFDFTFTEEDFHHFSEVLASHFCKRWLKRKVKSVKAHLEAENQGKPLRSRSKKLNILDTVDEEVVEAEERKYESHTSLIIEWAHQRLPLPTHWFLSPLTTLGRMQSISNSTAEFNHLDNRFYDADIPLLVKSGLFFLLGLEAMSSSKSDAHCSSISTIPLVWKLHSLSMVFLVNDAVLDEQTKHMFEILQKFYGQKLDQERGKYIKVLGNEMDNSFCHSETCHEKTPEGNSLEILNFQRDVHSSYSSFIETLVGQFASVSYGDMAYGRQLAIYLHRSVDIPVRLATWNALSDARVMDLLPTIENCIPKVEGFLYPPEDNEEVLEAYAKSWISGSLDRAALRESICFTIAMHHLSSLFFINTKMPSRLRNKLVKSLLRDYCRKQERKAMLLRLIRHEHTSSTEAGQLDKKFQMLREACEGNSSLLSSVEKLKCVCSSSAE